MNKQGFTLIDLVVIITILGILFSIAAPVLFKSDEIETNVKTQTEAESEYIKQYEAKPTQTIKF